MNKHRTYRVGDHLFTLNIPKGTLSEKELTSYAPFQTAPVFQTDSAFHTDIYFQTNLSFQTDSSFQASPYGEEEKLFTLTFTNDVESLATQTNDSGSLAAQTKNPGSVTVPTNDPESVAAQTKKPKSLAAQTTPTANLEDENGKMAIFTHSDGSLTIYLTTISGCECCRLRITKDYHTAKAWIGGTHSERRYALDTTLMLLYAFASSPHNTLLLHASAVEYDGKGYLFLGKSGTGKSTHSRLWLNHIPGTKLLNDDNPVIRIIDGQCFVYGSPWSGKTPCYLNRRIPIGGIVRLSQALSNHITRLSPIKAYAAILPSCSHMKWNHEMSEAIHNTLTQLLQNTKIYHLECLPNKEAAHLCKTGLQA